LYCAVPYRTVLYCTVLWCTVLCYTMLHCSWCCLMKFTWHWLMLLTWYTQVDDFQVFASVGAWIHAAVESCINCIQWASGVTVTAVSTMHFYEHHFIKVWTLVIAPLTWVRLVTSSAFTISEVAADWHDEPVVPQCIMWPSIARANRQLDPRCS